MAPRLLRVCDLSFETSHEVPYAILSHRWSSQETSLADIKAGRAGSKVSDFARFVQYHVPGVEHIWVDTCCINQDSDSELSRSINRMFEYYRNATACIVFLQDVTHPLDTVSLRKSVWFTRGWTLQELLASTVVIFVTARWEVIGHKGKAAHLEMEVGPNIEVLLAERTMIPLDVLQDFSTSRLLSVDERLMWLEGRETQEEEDMYYSVFGIFGVTPGVNYGEGKRRARKRLVEAIRRENVSLEPDDHDRQKSAGQPGTADIEAWLRPADAGSSHATAREQYGPGTCMWFLQHDFYTSWKAGKSQHLWIHGKPGCGKTILCSTVIEDLRSHCQTTAKDVAVVYFYFTFSDDRKQSYNELVLSLIAQIAAKRSAHSALLAIYGKSAHSRPTTRELENILLSTFSTLDAVFLVIDALDESPESSGNRRTMLQRLFLLLSNASNAKLLATSRYLPDIRAFTEDLRCEMIPMDASYVSIDIQRHMTTALAKEPRLREFAPATKALIKANITDNADGMFRWANLLLEELRNVRNSAPTAILAALRQFPRHLDDVYDRMLQGISAKDQGDARVLLTWITYAREPLTLEQLVEILVIDHERNVVRAEDRCQPGDILWLLGSLVILIADDDGTAHFPGYGDENSDSSNANDKTTHLHNKRIKTDLPARPSTKIRLAHFTVQEYLESSRILAGGCKFFHLERSVGHLALTQDCIAYILYNCSTHADPQSLVPGKLDLPLLGYARKTWSYHASRRGSQGPYPELLILSVEDVRRCWLRHIDHNMSEANPEWVVTNSALEVASYLGLFAVVKYLTEVKGYVKSHGDDVDAALRQAAGQGHIHIVKLLLEEGADVNSRADRGNPALHMAVLRNRVDIVQMLIKNDADLEIQSRGDGGSPLYHAARSGSIEMTKVLLQGGADPNVQTNNTHSTVLEHAVWYKKIEYIKLLLEHGADPNALSGIRAEPALYMASGGGSVAVIKLLLKHGADINDDRMGITALSRASRLGHTAAVGFLLENGAVINAPDKSQDSALTVAARHGKLKEVKLLIASASKTRASIPMLNTALAAAARWGEIEVVKLLLASGADVNAQGGDRMSALHGASKNDHCDVLRLLLASGAMVNAIGGEHLATALHTASAEGHCNAVELLLTSGADVNAEAADGAGTPLFAASEAGHLEVMKILTAAGAII